MTTDTPAKPGRATTRAATPPPEPYDDTGPATRLRTPRGRHRRPRPHRLLLTAGGLALAAGVLSLVRLTSDPGVGGLGTAKAGPRPDAPDTAPTTGPDTGRATRAAAITEAVAKVSPSATSPLGGAGAASLPGASHAAAPAPSTTAAPPGPAPGATAVPDPSGAPTSTTAPRTPERTAPHPGQPAAPSRPATAPAPQPPAPTHRPDLCVPVIGLCLDTPLRRD
ncbi:hypothetical protein [Streptomyces sp. ALI-76-A]|uniref:hypothetical protein n=1 Tax=Streptomyces sp. ALI-76-A TaxID=3025736 RepID=UPI00256ED3A4|nr:hypothetical protein [Streptomyces sp. ALI-76-A]MDL5203476.1 hypothetical protein [Streptomyces sp. ALI-76-A]